MNMMEKKNMSKFSKKIKQKYNESGKNSLAVYLLLRLLVIICAVSQFWLGNINNTFLCFLSLILFTLPTFFEEKLKIELPSLLESIVYIFIFSAEILGEINNFYMKIPYWDTILHTLNGFLCAGIGFSLVDLLNKNIKDIQSAQVKRNLEITSTIAKSLKLDEDTLNDKVQSIMGSLSCTSDVEISNIYVSDYWVIDNSLKDEDYQEDEKRHNKELFDR